MSEEPIQKKAAGLDSSKIVWAVAAGAISLLFVSSQQQQKNQADDIYNLPALALQVNTLAEKIEREITSRENADNNLRGQNASNLQLVNKLSAQVAGVLDSDSLDARFQGQATSINALDEALTSALEALEDQLNRRISLEIKDPINDRIDNLEITKRRRIDEVLASVMRLQDEVKGHISTPPNVHVR